VTTVYRIQTVDKMANGLHRRLGMCADNDRAERWRRTEEAALGVPCEVVPVDVANPVWAVPDLEYERDDPETLEPVPAHVEGHSIGGRS
jgi:hypothetical protein